METNLYCYIRTGRTISEKTMEDGNFANTKDEKTVAATLANLYSERPAKLTTNGHDFAGESSSPPAESYEPYRSSPETSHDDKARKRINPLRIHLGKRPFVDTSPQYCGSSSSKKKKPNVVKSSELSVPSLPRAPKLIPKRIDYSKFHNVSSQPDSSVLEDEKDKPVPRLVPKSQLLQFKKSKAEKPQPHKDHGQNLGLQPMVKFKCRKCCSMSFKTLAMLKEHQLVCRAQAKEPALSPEAAPTTETNTGGPSRVTRKVYLCSACGTYYENWNLFLHMREIHNRHICLFCLGMFSKAEKLSSHLSNKHNVKEFTYESKEELVNVFNGTLYLMCCACDEICSEQDDFFNHDCNKIKPVPVPVLVSKNAVKSNNSVKLSKPSNQELSANGSVAIKEPPRYISDKKELSEVRPDTLLPTTTNKVPVTGECEPSISNTSTTPEFSRTSKDTLIHSNTEVETRNNSKQVSSTVHKSPYSPDTSRDSLPNGDEGAENSDSSHSAGLQDSQTSMTHSALEKPEVNVCAPTEKERECGIKLKLSLNNAKSPVIINSTVDPTIGQQHVNKPTRVRRPPKRYEKDKQSKSPVLPKTPSIKMTICDKADNPFIKTTIYENNQETTMKTLLNNNLETVSRTPENTIKSTIYDNKIEDENSLNRVPKLTVRVPKELLDKDSSSDYCSDSDVSDKLTVDENNVTIDEQSKSIVDIPEPQPQPETEVPSLPEEERIEDRPIAHASPVIPEKVQTPDENVELPLVEPKTEPIEQDATVETTADEPPPGDELPLTELTLNKPLDKYPLKDLLKVFLASTMHICIYCNHARKIAINCEQLSLHMVAEHQFKATVDSITAEELMPETITAKVKTGAEELKEIYINLNSYDSEDKCGDLPYDHIFECFQCYFKTPVHKDLYLHNRKMHLKAMILCVMCKSNFYSYSELLCHLCPGTYECDVSELKFRCCLCNVDNIPSAFRLMVHLRKMHHTCDVCLEFCHNQVRLSNHVWKHKLRHFCYRCGLSYRNKLDITNHLFWKHGTQSVLCKKCLQKKWPHMYHFCSPPAIFICEECNLQFTKAVYLKVHKRIHAGEFPHICTEEGCTEKFVSKKLLLKHLDDHRKKLLIEDLNEEKSEPASDAVEEKPKETIPVIDLVDDKPTEETNTSEVKTEAEQTSKKSKKKKIKDALMLDVNLPELNLSESDSSDESDSGMAPTKTENQSPKMEADAEKPADEKPIQDEKPAVLEAPADEIKKSETEEPSPKLEEKTEPQEEKPDEKQVLEIWDNFKKYQEMVEKPKEKTPPLVPIRKHVCESDHDYCLIPTDINGEDDPFSVDKKKNKKSPKKRHGGLSSSSSSSSDSDSSCSCGSNCSCSSSSGSSSSSSSDSDSSNGSRNEKKKTKQRKRLSSRRLSNGSNVDVMGVSETPILIPEKTEPPIPETDLETEESETDEEFYDEAPHKIAMKLFAEKRNQLMMLAAPSDGGSASGEASSPSTPNKVENLPEEMESKEKSSSSKKKSRKKKKSKSSKKHGPIKINIPKDVLAQSDVPITTPLAPNKITISLQSNTVHVPPPTNQVPVVSASTGFLPPVISTPVENKRASKRRRVPNKFYGYSSDEDTPSTPVAALKPQQPPKLEWRKEDLPSPVSHKAKKEIPSTILPSHRLYNYSEPLRLKAPIPDPEPPKILMNSESMESSDSDSSDEGGLEIYQPSSMQATVPIPPPSYLNSGTSSLPYPFQRPAVRQAREGESVYCYCRCPYDEVSEMIACDAEGCPIEWFHFECVGIMVPPKGKWYCPECRKNQSLSGYR